MTAYYSDWYTLYQNAVPRLPVPGKYTGLVHVRRMPRITVPTGGYAAGDTIDLFPVKLGEVPIWGFVNLSAIAAGGIFSVGDGTTATKYSAETAANAILQELFNTPTTAPTAGIAFAADGKLTLQFKSGSAGVAAGTTIDAFMIYVPPMGNF